MNIRCTQLLAGALMLALLPGAPEGPTPALAQGAAETGARQIKQQQPGFLVRADVNHRTREYRDGDSFSVTVVSEIDAFVYVIYEQVDGKAFQVFPNRLQPENRLRAGQAVRIPSSDDAFRWKITAPYGKETVKVIATERPLRMLADARLRSKEFNPLSKSAIKGAAAELGLAKTDTDPPEGAPAPPEEGPGRWAETAVEITTWPASRELSAGAGKRHGVFFGVSEHAYAEYEQKATGRSPNLASPHADARVLDELMTEVGGLDQSRTFTNAQATRKNLETAICEWLPSVARPGDTVFIYFSGHGGQIDDDNRDEADGKDEFLVPTDYLGLGALAGLREQLEKRTLPRDLVPVAEAALKLVRGAGSLEKAHQILTRRTGVSDDLFARWLQNLDGRQVVVVLDICHSGGFATREKGAASKGAGPGEFDFLDRELARLKDIGQPNTALLTASATGQLSLVRLENDLSVMTWYLAEAIFKNKGPLTLDEAYAQCASGMKTYFESETFRTVNRQLVDAGRIALAPHQPQLYKPADHSIFLKP